MRRSRSRRERGEKLEKKIRRKKHINNVISVERNSLLLIFTKICLISVIFA
jgi:hypothetical protein